MCCAALTVSLGSARGGSLDHHAVSKPSRNILLQAEINAADKKVVSRACKLSESVGGASKAGPSIILLLSTFVYAASYSNTVKIQRVLDPSICTALRFLISCVLFLPNVASAMVYMVRSKRAIKHSSSGEGKDSGSRVSNSNNSNSNSMYYKLFTQGAELGAWMSLAFGAQVSESLTYLKEAIPLGG